MKALKERTIWISMMAMLATLCLANNVHTWDANYQYRKKITVTNNDSIQLGVYNLKSFVISAWQQVDGTKAL